jgi:nucleoside-diphosphate-sugar epimerase
MARLAAQNAGWKSALTEPRVLVRTEDQAADWWNRGAEVAVGDLRDPEAVRRAVSGVDAIVHLAAAFRGVEDQEAYAVNRDATLGLAEAALAAGVPRLVCASTNLVYGPGRGRPAAEDDETRPEGADGRIFNVADDAPVTAWELCRLIGEPLEGAAERPLDDPWAGIVDTARIRAELGYRPLYPSVYAAQGAGAR